MTAAACLYGGHTKESDQCPLSPPPERAPHPGRLSPADHSSPRFQSGSPPTPSLPVRRPAPSALGPTYLRLRAGAVGTGWPWLWAWLWPGGGAARLRAGSMPAGARPGRTAGLPMYGEPGGPMGAPWWGIRAPDGIPGRWGGVGWGGKQKRAPAGQTRAPAPGAVSCVRLPHPEPPDP